MCRWLKDRYRGTKFRRMVAMVAIAPTVYMAGKNRNSAYWNQVIMTIDKTVIDIKYMVKNRIVQILSSKIKGL